jgi:hypothetical protein
MKRLLLILTLAIVPLAFAQGPTSTVNSTDLEASHVIKSGPGFLILLLGYNSGAEQYIQVHNATSPTVSFKVGAGQNFSLAIPSEGMRFSTGIVVCNSSTAEVKTIGAADCLFNAVIR